MTADGLISLSGTLLEKAQARLTIADGLMTAGGQRVGVRENDTQQYRILKQQSPLSNQLDDALCSDAALGT